MYVYVFIAIKAFIKMIKLSDTHVVLIKGELNIKNKQFMIRLFFFDSKSDFESRFIIMTSYHFLRFSVGKIIITILIFVGILYM